VISRTKIDWCDFVWNPVWGCRHSCPYCYARKFAKRFAVPQAYREKKAIESPGWTLELLMSLAGRLQAFEPTFLWSNFNKPFPKKPSRIFVDSMSDFMFWKPDWKEVVLQRIRRHPEHIFLFLTKDPRAYERLSFPPNCWLGFTVTRQAEIDALSCYPLEVYFPPETVRKHEKKMNLFLSIEPILEPVKLTVRPDWLILGAETGNRKEKVVPEPEWLYPLVFDSGIPVFMKRNLREVWQMPLIRRFPQEMGRS
jgi:protein gp37